MGMSRSERLLDLIQVLRRFRQPVSGRKLAQELGTSIRTLYRDIASLQAQGASIEGEPGVGYVLRPALVQTAKAGHIPANSPFAEELGC